MVFNKMITEQEHQQGECGPADLADYQPCAAWPSALLCRLALPCKVWLAGCLNYPAAYQPVLRLSMGVCSAGCLDGCV